jgi:S1-C subfamily serine protease
MRYLIAFAVLAFVAFAFPAHAWDLNQLNKRADENLVQVGNGCSGTLVDVEHRLIFTAYHCIDQAIEAETQPKVDDHGEVLVGPDGKLLTAVKKKVQPVRVSQYFWVDGKKQQVDYWSEIVARNQKLDVAILKIPATVGPLKLAILASEDVPLGAPDYHPQRGSVVWHIGNPMMLYGTVTRGIVSSNDRSLADYGIEDNAFFVQFDGGMTGGSSGGAIYDDTGTFIGITTLGAPNATFIGLAVPMADVWKVAEDACLAADLGGENPAKCGPKPSAAPMSLDSK